MSVSVGIDLGTSTSEIAAFRRGRPEFLRDIRDSNNGILPSIVALGTAETIVVGNQAKRSLDRVAEVKRQMGTDARISLGGKEFPPPKISALILRHLKENAERILGEDILEAVITVPHAFRNPERQATKDAAEMAGLRVTRLINEPMAAALAYGMDQLENNQRVLVFDLGGGTFDVSVLELFDGIFEVQASAGDRWLGGKDFDDRIIAIIQKEIVRQHGADPTEGSLKGAMEVKDAAEKAKVDLSSSEAATIDIPYLGESVKGLRMILGRREFEIATKDLIHKTGEAIEKALRDAKLQKSDIDEIILVGGSTRIPAVRDFVSELFGGRRLPEHVPPDEAVALGAAIQAALIKEGRAATGYDMMIVTDITPHSLGMAIVQYESGMWLPDRMSVHIQRQTTIPAERKMTYTTTHDDQTSVIIRVYEGEEMDVTKNSLLGQFTLSGIPPSPAGVEGVDVTFKLDRNALLTIQADVQSTGESVEFHVDRGPGYLSSEEKERAAAELEDQWRKSKFISKVEPIINAGERQLDSLEGADKKRVEALLTELRAALAANDEAAVDELDRRLTDILFDLQ